MASIKAIDQSSVHRIHAGQVVLDLQGAIKELVENALDAGATSIDVRIKDQGLESIEVIDNGSGISEEDWPFIALKHHTSKLPSLDHIPHVTTFGFRGEAMSSLCALCESVNVVTATKETEPMGAIIQLGRDGKVINSSGRVARMRGTNVTLNGLFVPLPVRRKEFERTIKRELPKALALLQAYALIPASKSKDEGRPGVRLKVETVSSDKKGKRSTMLSTDGRGSLRSSVISVWGSKALDGVLDLALELEVHVDPLMARREGLSVTSQMVKVTGLISSASWGQGRSSADRQFFYINGRPCDLKQVGRTINEVYKSFNTHQVPFAVIDFELPPESIDINVSPDKRTIFLHSEANFVAALRAGLEDFFSPSRSAYSLEGASKTVKLTERQSQLPFAGTQVGVVDASDAPQDADHEMAEEADQEDEAQSDSEAVEEGESQTSLDVNTERLISIPASPRVNQGFSASTAEPMIFEGEVDATPPSKLSRRSRSSRQSPPQRNPAKVVQHTLDTTTASWSPDRRSKSSSSRGKSSVRSLRDRLAGFASQGSEPIQVISSDEEDVRPMPDGPDSHEGSDEGSEELQEPTRSVEEPDEQNDDNVSDNLEEIRDEPMSHDPDSERLSPINHGESRRSSDKVDGSSSRLSHRKRGVSPTQADSHNGAVDEADQPAAGPSSSSISRNGSGYRDEITSTAMQGEMTLRFDLSRLRKRSKATRHTPVSPRRKDAFGALADGSLTAAAGIHNRDSTEAEGALARVISKADFARMEILGQFNKGFIIARLCSDVKGKGRSDDLFIIDQHACDEKYNFETLQRTTVMKAQKLIRPRPLQLTAGDEIVAVENLDILRANGFEVLVDEDKAPGRGERVSLQAMPVSKDTTFDFKDLEQLLHMLSDGTRPEGQMVRCSKARSMFAMRACRKSVMIGKSLTRPQMVQLVRNMGTIDQPWNCPHGRPTMRHLTKIEKSELSRTGAGRIDWTRWDDYHG